MKNRFKIFTILSALACLGLAFGERALANPETAVGVVINGDTADGFSALGNDSPGAFNSGFGWFSQGFAPTFGGGLGNTSIGAGSLDIGGGSFGTAAGAGALLLNFTASDNTAVGFETLLFNDVTAASLAVDNTAVGFQALLNNIDAAANTAVGSGALLNNDITGNGVAGGNTAVGFDALFTNDDGSANTAVGVGALLLNDGFNRSTAVGFNAGLLSLSDETTAVGTFALGLGVNTGAHNTAVGFDALVLNDIGANNTATGHSALEFNTSGSDNTAFGWQALRDENTGSNQTAMGSNALLHSNGVAGAFDNSAFGRGALESALGAARNTALGDLAGTNIVGGFSNTIVGADSGDNLVEGDNNTYVGADTFGTVDEDNTIRINNSSAIPNPAVVNHSRVYIGRGTGFTPPGGALFNSVVLAPTQFLRVNAAGQVGAITVSSERFKKDIKPMAKASEAILALKPVTFHYKVGDTKTLCFGLIAEEVAKVDPSLVAFDPEGKPEGVLYEDIPIRLLNEFLKEHKKVEEQQATITELKSTVAQQAKGMEVLTAQLKEQAAQIQKVSAQVEMSKPAPQVVVNKP